MRSVSAFAAIYCIVTLSGAHAAQPAPALEDSYIAARDAAIDQITKLYDVEKSDDGARKAEEVAHRELREQMNVILAEPDRKGFAPPELNLDTFSRSDLGFGMLDGLRFDAETGKSGEKAGSGADGKYVEPGAHIVITTEHMFARWLRAHKDWWDKEVKNVPQQIGAALKHESFYTQAISTDAAVINLGALPIATPAGATFAYDFLAGRTQDAIPDAANEVFVSARANGKVYLAYGSIDPKVQVRACSTMRAEYNKRAELADEKFRMKQIDKKAYDKLGNLRQQGEDAYRRCFTEQAPRQAAFTAAVKQAQALVEMAMGR